MNDSHSPLKAAVLAAGKGKRMKTEGVDLPKVMRAAGGSPLLRHVLGALDFIRPEDTIIVVGYMRETIEREFPGYAFAVQEEQLGTGHAALSAFSRLEGFEGDLLVCCGDMPLLRRETYVALTREHRRSGAACTLLSGFSDVPLPYGRVLRDGQNRFFRVVEERDCTPVQREIKELNSGVYVFDALSLGSVLSELRRDNAQGEYYLTDAPALMLERGLEVNICCRELGLEIIGVNTPEQLGEVEKALKKRELAQERQEGRK